MIPKNIHLVFLNKEEEYPSVFSNCIQRIEELHCEWNINVYNKDDAQNILEENLPQYLSAYNQFKYDVQRADFLRLALVYIYGGFYMDMDIMCLKPLDKLLHNQIVLAEEKTISVEEQTALGLHNRLRIANYMFGGESGQEFWLLAIKRFAERANTPILSQQDIVDITGPGLLTDLYHEAKDSYPEITLLENKTKRCLQPYHNAISCHFGDYAAHLHTGTWRKTVNK